MEKVAENVADHVEVAEAVQGRTAARDPMQKKFARGMNYQNYNKRRTNVRGDFHRQGFESSDPR